MKITIYTTEENLHEIHSFLTSTVPYEHNIQFSLYKEDVNVPRETRAVEVLLDYKDYFFLQDFKSEVPGKFKE